LVAGTAAVSIDKSLHLFSTTGAQLADTLVIRPGAAVQLTGITRTGATVVEEGARLVARECRFVTPEMSAAVIAGAQSRLEFTNCRFAGGAANAVRLRHGASACIVDCGFGAFESPAVSVEDPGSAVDLIGCRFSGMRGHAVLVEHSGQARLFECSFDHFGGTGWTAVIAVSSSGRAELSRCRFTAMRAHGVVVRRGGSAIVSDCRFEDFGPSWAAVCADEPGSHAELSRCRCTTVPGPAVTVAGGATVAVGDCSFDTALGAGLLHGNVGLAPDGSQLRVSGVCSFRGAPVRVTRSLDRRDAAGGATVTVSADVPSPCAACNGSGAAPGATLRACPGCDESRQPTCALCRGAGLTSDDPCAECGGRGETTSNRTIEFTIPGEVHNGDTLVARGRGGSGLGGGPPGDLHIVIDLPDPPFRSVEEFVEKKLGIRIAQEDPGPDDQARRELDEAVRREAIRLGLLPADGTGDRRQPPEGYGSAPGGESITF
jgi:hypothetical protein